VVVADEWVLKVVRAHAERTLSVKQKQNRPRALPAGGSLHDRLDTVQISPVPSDVQARLARDDRLASEDSKTKADSISGIGFCFRR
jgi:hypothetical protein